MTDTDLKALIWMTECVVCVSVLLLGWLFTRRVIIGFRNKSSWLRKITPLKLLVGYELVLIISMMVIINTSNAPVFWAAMISTITSTIIGLTILCLIGRY